MISPETNYVILAIVCAFVYSLTVNAIVGRKVIRYCWKKNILFRRQDYTLRRPDFKDDCIIVGFYFHLLLAGFIYLVFIAEY